MVQVSETKFWLPVRSAQLVFAIVTLALDSASIHLISSGSSRGQNKWDNKFLLAASVITIISLVYRITTYLEARLQHRLVVPSVELLNVIILAIGWIATAVLLSQSRGPCSPSSGEDNDGNGFGEDGGDGRACTFAAIATGFGAATWAGWVGSLYTVLKAGYDEMR